MTNRYTITYTPGVNFGGPTTANGGPAEAMASRVAAGESVAAVAEDCGVDRADVLAAVMHAMFVSRHHFRVGDWATTAYTAMARDDDPDRIPDPPSPGVKP